MLLHPHTFISAESLTKYINVIFVCDIGLLQRTLETMAFASSLWCVLYFFYFYFLLRCFFCSCSLVRPLRLFRCYFMLFGGVSHDFPLSIINCFWSSSFSGWHSIFLWLYSCLSIRTLCSAVCIESEWVSVCVENSLWKLKICRCCIEQLSVSVCRK